MVNPQLSLLGQNVQGYEILRILGAGGMGKVYLARHGRLDTLRAIKVIHDDLRGDASAAARFRQEARSMTALDHPCIANVIDFGTLENGWPFLCLEYVEGRTLDQTIDTDGCAPVRRSLAILGELAAAVSYAHDAGIIHRDLKPANVILRPGSQSLVTIIDFGLARLLSDEVVTRLTGTHELMGSPEYMAPEQVKGSRDVGPPADIYALGGIAHKLLTGQPAFGRRPMLELLRAHRLEPPVPLSVRCNIDAVSPTLDELIGACLAKKPADRPSAAELATALAALLAQGSGQNEPKPAAARSGGVAPTVPPKRGPGATVKGVGVAPSARLRSSPAWRRRADRITRALYSAPDEPPSDLGTALRNQLSAVIDDIAAALAPKVSSVEAAYRNLIAARSSLDGVAIDLAVVGAEPSDQRDQLSEQKRQLESSARAHGEKVLEGIERARNSGREQVATLFDELDQLVARIEAMQTSE